MRYARPIGREVRWPAAEVQGKQGPLSPCRRGVRRPRGFTLTELSYVLVIMALLTAMAVPGYEAILRRAQAQEARGLLHRIADAELRHCQDTGLFLACGAGGAVPVGPEPFPAADRCWRMLGVRPEGPVRYHYEVVLDGASYRVVARADLDGDGIPGTLTLSGRDLSILVQEPLE